MRALLFCLLLTIATPITAAPLSYQLDTEGSVVGFETDFGQSLIHGQMPVTQADLILDFDRVAASHVNVTLNAGKARSNLPFATVAMKGNSVLDTKTHPLILFESTRMRPTATGAEVLGRITVRGVTRDIKLNGTLYRPVGSDPGERENLSILLTGAISRAAFGAAGFPDLVGDEVRLKILAKIQRVH
ncbi:MAG: YceI family protein [Albidovulum sp.]